MSRALSKLGVVSRKEAEEYIVGGRVSVNGVPRRNPAFRVSMSDDRIAVDGHARRKPELVYILLHKPAGVVTTRSDERGRPTVYGLLGELQEWVFPVGRLDMETSGLLLMTNDHRIGELLTNPRSKVPKVYEVILDRPLREEDRRCMEEGMMLGSVKLLPAEVMNTGIRTIQMTITEGKNRQIRRMCKQLGYEVIGLSRVRIGSCGIGSLAPGGWRHLTKDEIAALSSAGGRSRR